MMISKNIASHVGGISRGALPFWIREVKQDGKMLLLIPDDLDPIEIAAELTALDRLPEEWSQKKSVSAAAYPVDDEPSRQAALHDWLLGKTELLASTWEGAALPCDDPASLGKKYLLLKPGLNIGRLAFETRLSDNGYMRNEWTDQVGEYAIRGDVIDLWPSGMDNPVRLVWNIDTLESIRSIDPHTQRSGDYYREIPLRPCKAGSSSALLDVLPNDVSVVIFGDVPDSFHPGSLSITRVSTGTLAEQNEGFEPPPVFSGNIDLLRKTLIQWTEEDRRVAIFCHNQGEKDRLEELLIDPTSAFHGTKPPWLPPVLIGDVERGFVHQGRRLALLTNSEIFGRYRKRVRLPKFETGSPLTSLLEIKPNDFLVHERYGVGRYLGLKSLKVDKVTSEYLQIEYRAGDRVYVPIFELQQVQKYVGAEGKRPQLSSLDTAAWERVKSKVKEDVAKLAKELLEKAARRSLRPGHSFASQSHLEKEFADSFMYKLTPDQEKTLQEVETDMASPRPMDRLICGDVGFGKTEIAMRAALKCALASKQVAFLCPTTILAEQHWRNFSERLADYPINVQLLSRFQDRSEQKGIIEAIGKGGVDIIIGTHRLLSKDVQFKDLGLIIIDEEHRFGVRQKTKLLGFRETVDVLSLTATPIPRTLASSMGGIKDLSVIETPPEGRLPILTHVGVFDEDLMVKAVETERGRGGQVFYVHNRVKTLLARKEWLESVLPSVRIAMAHGQMSEDELETAMHDFLHKRVDVLLATTIIESGLDIPSVNTLVVEEAEEMGLAQLYQLRGRVGRSATRAYCYLFHTNIGLTTEAKKRLEALKEFTALGSGFRLALRDMEIRGAGNLLGPQQHGNIAAVGIETYSKLLGEEIQRLKGQPVDERTDGPVFELNVSAYLPADYVPSEMERVTLYKKILSSNEADLDRLAEALVDRCGPFPLPAKVLFDTARLRLVAKSVGLEEVHEEEAAIRLHFKKGMKLPQGIVDKMMALAPDHLTFVPGDASGVRFLISDGEDGLGALKRFFETVFKKGS